MTTQILRKIDRWRFETPLALALGASAGFFAWTAPAALFEQLPVVGAMGTAGRAIAAALLALVAGGVGYVAMRRKGSPAAPMAPATVVAEAPAAIVEEEPASGMPAERFRRFRRADRHPDAPPREPIIASRDLGEPFMAVGGFAPPVADPSPDEEPWWPDDSIPDGEFVEVADEPAPPHPAASASAEAEAEEPPVVAAAAAAAEPVEAPFHPAPARTGTSIAAMMERLSNGLERRAAVTDAPPARDMRPALRDALDELNRLAERRD